MTLDIGTLRRDGQEHRRWLAEAKEGVAEPVDWYPYDTLGNLAHLDALLEGHARDLGNLAAGLPVADIGGADGDMAFLLEKEGGLEVDIVDNGPTNFNGLRGARALASNLGSAAAVCETDLDSQFALPRERYGLVLFLGILYHLKNPLYALEQLARSADYCLLSTRVARFAGPRETEIAELPVAYLVGETELNNDPTNFWIFSPAGLARAVERAGWTCESSANVGSTGDSTPDSNERDERMFMLLRSGSARP